MTFLEMGEMIFVASVSSNFITHVLCTSNCVLENLKLAIWVS